MNIALKVILAAYIIINTTIAGGWLLERTGRRLTFNRFVGWLSMVAFALPLLGWALIWYKIKDIRLMRELKFRIGLFKGSYKGAMQKEVNDLERLFGEDSKADPLSKLHWSRVKHKYGYEAKLSRRERRATMKKNKTR